VLQLYAYGLMLIEQHPRASVMLVVDDGNTEHSIQFDAEAQASATDKLRELAGSLPDPGAVSSARIALPGNACSTCDIRVVCPAYRQVAPEWWRSYPDDLDRAPLDVSGTVLAVTERAGAFDVLVKDLAQRRVLIRGLEKRHADWSALLGRGVSFFNLESSGSSRDFGGKRFHPQSFRELGQSARDRRAWRAELFATGSTF
jgi:hypothetical protein